MVLFRFLFVGMLLLCVCFVSRCFRLLQDQSPFNGRSVVRLVRWFVRLVCSVGWSCCCCFVAVRAPQSQDDQTYSVDLDHGCHCRHWRCRSLCRSRRRRRRQSSAVVAATCSRINVLRSARVSAIAATLCPPAGAIPQVRTNFTSGKRRSASSSPPSQPPRTDDARVCCPIACLALVPSCFCVCSLGGAIREVPKSAFPDLEP